MTHKKTLEELELSGKFGSVVIKNCSCTISSTLCTQHFSFEHAPSLPLKGCTATNCTCEYQGIIDRRLGGRRVTNCSTCFKDDNRKCDRRMEELLKNDEFIQYIISTYLPTNDMTHQEKIQSVFSSMEEFSIAMDSFKLCRGTTREH